MELKVSYRFDSPLPPFLIWHDPVIFNPRLTGGGAFDAPLPNIRDSSKTNSAIDVKLGRPSHTTILHRP